MTRSSFLKWSLILLVGVLIGIAGAYLLQNDLIRSDTAATLEATQPPIVTQEPAPPTKATAPPEKSATAEPMEPSPEAQPTAEAVAPPAPTLFDQPWDDRSPWQAGMVEAARDRANGLAGASIYHMRIEIAGDYRSFSGEQEVYYTNTEQESLDDIYFRLFPNLFGGSLTIDALTLNGETVVGELELEGSALRLPLAQPLAPGSSVVVGMSYQVEVPELNDQNYGAFVFAEEVLALAHAYPLIPAYNETGWNVEIPPPSGDVVFADSSFYLVELTMPEELTMAVSGTVIDEQVADGKRVWTIASGATRDFYMAGSPGFVELSEQVGETTLRSYAMAGQEEANAEVLRVGAASLELFNSLIGPYPFTELEMAATPNLALGIEYPGVVVMTDRLYREDGFSADVPRVAYLESTVVHEVGHQWFYSTVGNDQLDAPWLDEALAQYITYRYYETLGEQAATGFRDSLEGRWQRVGNADIPIGLPVAGYTPQEYGAIIYGRGPLFFIDALEVEMGQPAFDEFLQQYYTRYYFDVATSDGMKTLAEKTCECDLSPLWEEWVGPGE